MAEFNFHILLGDVLQHHVDVYVEPAEGANELLVPLHDHPDLGPDAAVDQICSPAPTGTCTSKQPIQERGSEIYNTATVSESRAVCEVLPRA